MGKEFCCSKTGQGCTTTPMPFDCNAGLDNWEEGFSPGKKEWCCANQHIACDEWDCNFGVPDIWRDEKSAYCCPRTGQGCVTTSSAMFDCDAGFANWDQGWSPEKKTWCCQTHRLACDPWDCAEGDAVDDWSQAKRDYCCPRNDQGCSAMYSNKLEVVGLPSQLPTEDSPFALQFCVVGVSTLTLAFAIRAGRRRPGQSMAD